MPNAAASRLVLSEYSESLAAETARGALREIGGHVSCGVVFCSPDYRENLPDFLETLQVHGHIPTIVGCSGTGLIGTEAEAENAQGFSLLLMHLPQTELRTYTLSESDAAAWDDRQAVTDAIADVKPDAWMLLADPSNVPIEPWLASWTEAFPDTPCFGGLASGGSADGDVFVFHDRELIDGGGIALGFKGGIKVHNLVSHGCRPIGEPLPVTGVDRNVIQSIGSRPAFRVLDEAFQSLSDQEKQRARGNLFAGLAVREDREEFHRGDFLIRNIIGADESSGAVAIEAFPRVGQTLQWQLRDAKAADDDLRTVARRFSAEGVKPFASLVFSCGGRGRLLFGSPNHDASVIAEHFGRHPSAGYFCNGEIGPIGTRSFVHGYTASVALFE